MNLRILSIFCLFLIGCQETPLKSTVLELPDTNQKTAEKTAEKSCVDSYGNAFGPDDLIVFWDYAKLDPVGTTYTPTNLGIQFQYEGTQSVYYPLESAVDLAVDKFVKFSDYNEVICVGDDVENATTQIEFYENGILWEDTTAEEWMKVISEDEGRPIETVKFGENTFSRIKGTNLGSGLVDFYFIEHEGNFYEFTFAWTAPGAFGQEEWWTLYPLPEEYKKVLETVEFL